TAGTPSFPSSGVAVGCGHFVNGRVIHRPRIFLAGFVVAQLDCCTDLGRIEIPTRFDFPRSTVSNDRNLSVPRNARAALTTGVLQDKPQDLRCTSLCAAVLEVTVLHWSRCFEL